MERTVGADRAAGEAEESRFQALSDAAFEAIFFLEAGRIVEVNSRAVQLFGYGREDLIGMAPVELAAPESAEAVEAHVRENRSGAYRILARRRDGSTFPAEVCGRPTQYRGREVRVAAIRDLSGQEKEEQQIRESERRFRAIFNATFQLMGLLHPDGTVAEINETALVFFNLSRDEVVGRYVWDVFAPTLSAEGVERLRKSLYQAQAGLFVRYEERLEVEGRAAYIDLSMKPVLDEAGEVVMIIPEGRDITDQKKAEQARREHFAFLTAVLENSAEGIVACDAEGRVAFLNQTARSWHGLQEAPVPAERWAAHYDLYGIDGERLSKEEIPLWRALKGEQVRGLEMRIIPEEGPQRLVLASAEPLLDPDGRRLGAVAIMHDITERQQAEEAVRRSEEWLRALTESAIDAIVTSDSRGRIIDWNRGARILFGYEKEEAVGQLLDMLMPERYVEAHRKGMERVSKTGRTRVIGHTVEMHGVHKSGTEFPLELSLAHWHAGGETFYTGIMRDITERRQAEEAVRRSEERFAKAFRLAPVAVGITTLEEGRFIDVNACFTRLTGYSREELIGRTSTELALVTPRTRAVVIEKLRAEGGYESLELRIRNKAGQIREVLASGEVADIGGETCILGMYYDVTTRKQLEREVMEIGTRERQMIAQDLHDGLAQQLSGMSMLLAVLKKKAGGQEELIRVVDRISELTALAARETRALARGLFPVNLESGGLLDGLHELAANVSEAYGVNCAFEERDEVLLDNHVAATHLYRITQEAVSNAARHGKADHIRIIVAEEDLVLLLRIEDDGIGIENSEPGEKSGIGLRTMQIRARMVGGTLEIRPREGGGTVVQCRVPLERMNDAVLDAGAEAQ